MDVSDPIERALKREIPLLAYLVRELDTPRWHKFTVVSAPDQIRTPGATPVGCVEGPCTYVYKGFFC
jgi:hypothetical protein